MALLAQRTKLPMCKHCTASGTPQWITACGDHHQESCERYRPVKCFTCKGCPTVGTAEWVTTPGQHHDPRCKRRSKDVLITCVHCDIVGTKEKVTMEGPHHGPNCPRNPVASSWFGSLLFGSCCCTKQDISLSENASDYSATKERSPPETRSVEAGLAVEVMETTPEASAREPEASARKETEAATQEGALQPSNQGAGPSEGADPGASTQEGAPDQSAQDKNPRTEEEVQAEAAAGPPEEAEAAPQKMQLQVQIPEGAAPNSKLQIQIPGSDKQCEILVPPNVVPGQTVTIEVYA